MVSVTAIHPSNAYQNTTFHGPTLTITSLSYTSEVWPSAILKWLKLQD